MLIKKELTYYKRLFITPERINELEELLNRYCEVIKYDAKTNSGTTLSFESREELLEYDNFKNGKIVSLDISCRSKDYSTAIEIGFAPSLSWKNISAKCNYKFTDNDSERLFVDAWTTFLKKATEYQKSYVLCQITTLVFGLSLGVYLLIRYFNTPFKMVSYMPLMFYLMYLFIRSPLKDNTIWSRVFPPVVFSWGEEAKKYSNYIRVRSNLFWVVVVPTVISIVFEIISIGRM